MLLSAIAIFFTGLLAGEEVTVCLGLRGLLARMEPEPQLLLRQGLIRRLRILVPLLWAAALIASAAVTLRDAGSVKPIAGLVLLVGFMAVTLTGTVPINQIVLGWTAAEPPAGWHGMIRRWERLDLVRTVLAVTAFALTVPAVR